MNRGNILAGQVLYFHFTTRQFSTGAPITAASLALSVYKDDSTTESTTGVTTTYTSGFDSRAGLVSVKIDTSADGTFYAAGHDFSVVITGGTADSVSLVGEVVGYFSIQNRYNDLSTAGNAAVADKLLGRNLAGGSDGTRMVKDALRLLRNKWSISSTTLTVTAEDDTTTAWTAALTTAAGADSITAVDPA